MDVLESESNAERDMIRRWVDTWRSAGIELEAIRRRDAETASTHEAMRQIFEGMDCFFMASARADSGLVEQQVWFSRIRAGSQNVAGRNPNE